MLARVEELTQGVRVPGPVRPPPNSPCIAFPRTPTIKTEPAAHSFAEAGLMSDVRSSPSRRDFLKASVGGGFTLGSLLGLGLDLRAAQDEVRKLKIEGARETPSVCPYCAVG